MDYMKSIDLKDRQSQLAIAGAAISAVGAGYLIKRAIRARREAAPIASGEYTPDKLPKDCYDAVIVGAGACPLLCALLAHMCGSNSGTRGCLDALHDDDRISLVQ